MFSFMLRDRYPIFCSVFQSAAQVETKPELEPPIFDPDSFKQEFGTEEEQTGEINDYTGYDFADTTNDSEPLFTPEDDSVHDLEKINELIERMVISAASQLPKDK